MIKELAVEPEGAATWADLRLLDALCGVSRGVVISCFPQKWPRMVKDAADAREESWQNRQRVIAKLLAWKRGQGGVLLSFHREYRPGETWRTNAIREHDAEPFFSLIVNEKLRGCPPAIEIESLDPERFKDLNSISVPRTAADISEAVAPLVRLATEMTIVDPYFHPAFPGFVATLKGILAVFAEAPGTAPRRVWVHTSYRERDPGRLSDTFGNFERSCHEAFSGSLPGGIQMTIVRWVQKEGSERLHDRFLLADFGGVRFSAGIESTRAGETTGIELLGETKVATLREQYRLGSGVFAVPEPDQGPGTNEHLVVNLVSGS